MNFNKSFIAGNLTRDPELRFLPSNAAVVAFTIATNRTWKNAQGEKQEEVTFVNCEAFGKTAEVINQHFRKGKPIFVEGRIKMDQWTDKDGKNQTRFKVVAESFQFCGGDRDRPGDDTRQQAAPSRAPNNDPHMPIDQDPPF